MTDQANGGTAKRAHTLSSTLLPAIMHSISSMERRVANEVRLATGAWPGIGGDDASRARELIETYRSDAEKADIEHATLLLAEVARIHEEDLRDTRSATRAILEALRLDPNSTSVQRATFRLLLGTGKHTILAQLVDDLASELETSPGRNAILLDHALTAELSLGHQDRAAYVYQRVVEDDPESLEAIEGLLRVALRLRDWPRVARTARHLASHSDDDQTRRCLLITAALLDTERGEIEHAEWLAQAAALGEKPGVSLPLAVGIFLGNQDVEAALRILLEQGEKHAEKTGQFRFHASWILARSGERDAEAIIHAEAAAEKEPENLLYLSWLADLYDRTARWPDLAEVLKRKAALETTQEEKVETLIARAEVLVTHLGATDDAIVDLEKALEISPTDLACLQALGRLYTQARRYSDLAEMHFKEAERTNDNDRRAHALYRSAQVLDDRLQRRDDAIKHLEEALKTKPSLSSARRLLEELYRKTERYADLVDLYRDKIGQTEDKEIRASLFERIANLLDTQLNDAAGAVDAYEKLLELQPNNPAALSALSRLYHMHGEHTKLLSVLRAQAMTTEGATTRAEILLRMGQILEDDLGQADQALAHYREALDVHPIPSVYEQLGRLLHTTERWPDLIELLEHQIEHETVEKDERVALLFRLGRVHEQHIEDLSAAANAYQRALAENSAYWPAIRGIIRVAHHLPELQRKSLGELLLPQDKEFAEDQAMAQLRIAITLVDKQPVAMRELLAKLVAEGDKGIARDLFVQLLAEVGDHAKIFNLAENIEATAIALGALKDIDLALERSEIAGGDDIRLAALRWRELLAAATADTSRATEALSDRIAGESPGEARVALQLRLVKLLEDDLPAASTACKEIIDEDPTQQRALDLLEHLSRLAHDDTLQDFALGHREEQARTDTERAMVLTIRGHIYTRANKPWKAEDLWRQALTLDPHTRPAYEALKTFYSGQKNAEGLAWTLEQGLDSVLDKNARLQDLLLRADLRRADNNEEGLLRDLDEILEIDPCQPNALERVEAKLREMGDFEALVKRLDAARKTATTPLRKASLEAKLARIYLSELEDTHKAAELLDNAIDRDPDNVAALLISAEVRAKLDQPTEAIALLSRAILRSDDEQELLGAHLATAQIYHEELGVSDRALRSLRTVVELDPDNVAAHSLIAKIAEAAGDDANAEPHLRRLADLETDPRLKALALARLTEVLIREHGTENEEAVTAIAQAADLAPADPDLVQRAVEILKGAQAYERLDGILETAIQVLPEERLSDFLLRRGELLAEHLDRRSEARDLLRRVLAHVPEDEHAIELLIGLM
ncbi:MAG: tetratricopeptide repeat protein, partial [Deltaproteobacteria bacterium]|nr:tetratricopeptide repeat protein [Deltaproteobacteria bacterium]